MKCAGEGRRGGPEIGPVGHVIVAAIPGKDVRVIEQSILKAISEEGEGTTVSRNLLSAKIPNCSAATLDRWLKKLVGAGYLDKVRHGEYRLPPEAWNPEPSV